ncbi:MAG: pyridoxal-phosphate dependent enzyme [Candidatus Rokubacteria bacterium]|nr:pyridoxal-phosphate dependent enzyme [Candidatus Rokubacteria bacterium]
MSPSSRPSGVISLDDVRAAARRLRDRIHRTPVVTCRSFDEATGYSVFFKCENLQRAGSFKIRGALNKLLTLSEIERQRGVAAFSSGNHAQGVALAARTVGTSAVIVMPTDAARLKLAATRGYGAEVVFYDRQTEDREAIARRLAGESGRLLVPPYDDPAIISGQGTVALELFEDVPVLDALLTPVGGGGLMAGCSTVAKGLDPATRVFGVEAEAANDTWLSLQKGERVAIPPPSTIADGIRNLSPGELTFPILQQNLEGILLVSDEEIMEALRFLLFRAKLLVEPTGAVAAAALLAGKLPLGRGARVGVVLSGGNVDPGTLAGVIREASPLPQRGRGLR